VVAVDPRSQGRSSRTTVGNTYPQQGRDLGRVIEALDLHDLHLLGWSCGGLACYAYIEQFGTAHVRSFTVVDMSPRPFRPDGENGWAEGDLSFYLDEYLTPRIDQPEVLARFFIDSIVSREAAAEDRRRLMRMHLSTPRSAAASLLVSAMVSDYRDLAVHLSRQIPFANVVSPEWSTEARAWLSAHAPRAVVWDVQSHMGFREQSTEFNTSLTDFLMAAS
jgi:non-heme chloroperoxidase